MTNLRTYKFWVADLAGKKYINLKHVVKKNAEGKLVQPYRGIYLAPEARKFEATVRDCAEIAGVEVMDYIELAVRVFYPTRLKNGRVRVIKLGRPDLANVYKCVEDGLQKLRVPSAWMRTLRSHRKEMEAAILDERIELAEKRETQIAKLEEKIAAFKVSKALQGCAVLNDRDVLGFQCWTWFMPHDWKPCVHVTIRETTEELHYHKRLREAMEDEDEYDN